MKVFKWCLKVAWRHATEMPKTKGVPCSVMMITTVDVPTRDLAPDDRPAEGGTSVVLLTATLSSHHRHSNLTEDEQRTLSAAVIPISHLEPSR